jgi:putative N6-adenine-specific DNA methylase
MKLQLAATTTFGLETLVKSEIKRLGYELGPVRDGLIMFSGDENSLARANINLRCAERVLLIIKEFEARTFEELFENVKALPWHEWLPEDASFPVNAKSVKSQLVSLRACQSITKKAIVEKMKEKYSLSEFPETGNEYKILVSILQDKAIISLDTSGPGLHKRGYRDKAGEAPIKETLAAALVKLSRWRNNKPFLDPFCGSGTIPVEATLIARNIAPGIKRTFAAQNWPFIHSRVWDDAFKEARDNILPPSKIDITASDIDPEILKIARNNASRAGIERNITIIQRDFKDIWIDKEEGCLVTNLPYGKRMGEFTVLNEIYKAFTFTFRKKKKWSLFLLTSDPEFTDRFHRKITKRRKLFNGGLRTDLYQYFEE